jgi:HAD superfamily phosphoserine phosphatase-like hydrolase
MQNTFQILKNAGREYLFMKPLSIRLVAFDLDGTLLRRQTVCEILADSLGTSERMREFEQLSRPEDIRQAREEMVQWYRSQPLSRFCSCLHKAHLAPGVREGIALLKQHGIHLVLLSLTWEFAGAWFAQQWGIEYFVGTRLSEAGKITHVWPEDKARWLLQFTNHLQLDPKQVAAVGDSSGDLPMLHFAGYPIFVGKTLPEGLPPEAHDPEGNIYTIAQRIATLQSVHLR